MAATPAHGPFGAGYPTGPYPGPFVAGDGVELFTSDGPRRIFFDINGNLLPGAPATDFSATGGVVRQKPDITAADGVTTAAPGFNPFYGTSAAAPHAAAIAALVKQMFPSKTPAQIRTALIGSAIDIDVAGVDRNAGAGIVMANETLVANGAFQIAAITVGTITTTQTAGNGDASIDPGEDWKFDIVLSNPGVLAATGIVATLVSNTAGVVVTSGTVSYPSIAPGGSASNPAVTPFRFSVLNASCGTVANFTLTVTYSGGTGAPTTQVIPVNLGAPSGSTLNFAYTGGVVPIPDGLGNELPGATAAATLNVNGLGAPLGDVNFRFDGATCTATQGATTVGLDHSWVGDLVIDLVAPDSTTVRLVNRMGGGNNSGNNFCGTVLDDQSAGISIDSATSAQAPFTGSFEPSASLSPLFGKNGNGTWQLHATDYVNVDSGSIRKFSLDIRTVACAAPANPTSFTATKNVAGAPYHVSATVTYTMVLTNTGTGTQPDNATDEYTDSLPGQLTYVSAVATSGTVTHSGNLVKWNGALLGGAAVTITVTATINAGTVGQTVDSQGTVHFDPNHSGTNSSSALTSLASFVVAAGGRNGAGNHECQRDSLHSGLRRDVHGDDDRQPGAGDHQDGHAAGGCELRRQR